MQTSGISTDVFDLVRGRPAHGVAITLEHRNGDHQWKELARGLTNTEGRAPDLLKDTPKLDRGFYRITYETSPYFQSVGIYSFYPQIPIVFEVQDAISHVHIPLMISPHGYSTYRGS